MIIHLFDLKSEMQKNGIKMLDFLECNYKASYYDTELEIQNVLILEEKHICRPDLISYEMYGDVNYVDVILKFNQISNPFSMNIEDILIIPLKRIAVKYYQEDKLKTSKFINDTKLLFIDPSKASQKDIQRIKQLEKMAKKRANGASQIMPTNLLRDGEIPFIADGNFISFAPSISTSNPTSQSLSNE